MFPTTNRPFPRPPFPNHRKSSIHMDGHDMRPRREHADAPLFYEPANQRESFIKLEYEYTQLTRVCKATRG